MIFSQEIRAQEKHGCGAVYHLMESGLFPRSCKTQGKL